MTSPLAYLGISLAIFIALALAGRFTGDHALTWIGAAIFMTAAVVTAFEWSHDDPRASRPTPTTSATSTQGPHL